jgi:aminoglycoside 3-N-acetyltransferase
MHGLTNVAMRAVRLPVTGKRLVRNLRRLGVEPGQIVLMHASLKSLGWVVGGAPTVVSALRQVVGPDGHVVVPTGTEANSNTSRVHRARIAMLTPEEAQAYERDMPPFDRDSTPSGMGAISEALRTTRGAVRSAHPQSSFAAIGPEAEVLMDGHLLRCHLGEDSPLARLYQMKKARVLLLGVGYEFCSAFHLAEYRYTKPAPREWYSCAIVMDGQRQWITYQDVVLNDRDFVDIGKSLDSESEIAVKNGAGGLVKTGNVGNAFSRLIPLGLAVDHAQRWMELHRVQPRSSAGYQLL